MDWQEVVKRNSSYEEGSIYILSNKELPNMFKIGFSNDVEKRAKALKKATGLKEDFVIEKTWKTKNPYEVEQNIFKSLMMQKNDKGVFDSSIQPVYMYTPYINGSTFKEFVRDESLEFFCKRIEKFIQ